MRTSQTGVHSAEGAALGFYYQAFFALLTLMRQNSDNATIGVERLDDVELAAHGHTLLYQLKHSLTTEPPPITLRSRAFWRTVKAWIDVLPRVTLAETTFHLIAVGSIESDSALQVLTSPGGDRTELVTQMTQEARRVVDARSTARELKQALPYEDRAGGCEAFLALAEAARLNLLRRVQIQCAAPAIGDIEPLVAAQLTIIPPEQRPTVATRIVEWWDRQIVYSLSGRRDRVISRSELQHHISTIVADVEQARLVAEFETVNPPAEYQPDGMLSRQIALVEGTPSDHSKAIREEWRAREQRSRWITSNPGLAVTIDEYDRLLEEHWSDRHSRMVEECTASSDKEMCASGLAILRWTHDEAPSHVRPIAGGWNAAYYVRGSYQVLAINLRVGWHPDYAKRLGGRE